MGMSSIERLAIAAVALALVAAVVALVGRRPARLARLAQATTALTFVLVVFGAYVRLSDAGLGCPDWPGCYGDFTPSLAHAPIRAAEAQAPQGPVTMAKAWKEMLHRYLAMSSGCLILAMAVCAWRVRERAATVPLLACAIVGVVLAQGAFGALTVTLRLMPVIVSAHLLGGMATLLLLAVYALKVRAAAEEPAAAGPAAPRLSAAGAGLDPSGPVALARIALALLFMQIALGGWVSTNYAAPVCGELPACQGQWWPEPDFAQGFTLVRELGRTAAGEALPLAALTAIHLAHRAFALVVAAVLLVLVARLARRGRPVLAAALAAALALQVSLGLGVVGAMSAQHLALALQLPVAAAHNAGAAVLVLVLAAINFNLSAARATLPGGVSRPSLAPV